MALHRRLTGKVLHRAALDLLADLAPNSVGGIIMDPPFFIGIGRDDGGVGGDPWTGKDISTMDAMIEWSIPLARQVMRVLRPGAPSVVMGGSHSLSAWEVATGRAGLNWMAELSVLWNTGKPRARNFGSLTTTIRWHSKPGARHTFNGGERRSIYSNVLVCTKIPLDDRLHPAQKPVELTNFFVSLLTNPGDVIVDPFCGSGSTLVSAAMCGRSYIGGDIDANNCAVAASRPRKLDLEEAHLRPLYLWVNGQLHPVIEE